MVVNQGGRKTIAVENHGHCLVDIILESQYIRQSRYLENPNSLEIPDNQDTMVPALSVLPL